MESGTVGIIGSGVMGSGLAMNLLTNKIRTILYDISKDPLERFRENFINNLRLLIMFEPKFKDLEADNILSNLVTTNDIGQMKEADFVVENVTENWEIKKKVWEELDKICPKHTIFASNTSAIPITRQASVTNRADKVIGIHFMNPVPMKPFVEVIKGHHTSEETIRITHELLNSLGKKWVMVNDSPGFISNRVLMLTINEAIFLVHEKVASVEEIDKTFKNCFGHKMGPLETAELIGLDTILNSLIVLYESFNDSKYRPCPLLTKMVDAGFYGKKNGKGFNQFIR